MATAATIAPPTHSHLERLLFAYILDRNGIDESTIRLAATDLPTVPYLKDAHDTTGAGNQEVRNEETRKTHFSEKTLTELCLSLLNAERGNGSVKTLEDAKENENLLPSIIQKELKLYTDETIQSIKDDERTYAELKTEIVALETKIAKEGDKSTQAEALTQDKQPTTDNVSKAETGGSSVPGQDGKTVQTGPPQVVIPPSVPSANANIPVPPARTPAPATTNLPPQNIYPQGHGASPSQRQPTVSTMPWQGHLPPGASPYTPQSGYPVGQHGPAGQLPYSPAQFIPYDPQRQGSAMYSPYPAGQHHRGPPPMAYYPSGAAQAMQPPTGHYVNSQYTHSPSQPTPQALPRPIPATTLTPSLQPQPTPDMSKTPDPNTNIARITTPTPQPLPLPPQAPLFNGLFQTPERFAEFMRLRKSLPALATATNSPGTPVSVTRWKHSPKPKVSTKRSATPAVDDKHEKDAIPPARSPLLPSPTWPKRLDFETSARIDSLNQFSLADNDIDELAMATPTRVSTARGGMRGNRGGNLTNSIWMNSRQSMSMHEMDSLKKRPTIQSRPQSQNLDDEISITKASKASSVTSKEKHGEEIESRSLSQSPDPIRPAYRGTLNAAQKRKRAPSTTQPFVPVKARKSVGVEETPERVMKLDEGEAETTNETKPEAEQEAEPDREENPESQILAMKSLSRVANPLIADLSSHKFAGMFTKPITEREAPGYKSLIYQAQDLKSLRGLISAGTKAVTSYIEGQEDDTTVNHVFVPNTPDFRPPKAVVSAAQVECEIVRIFANAVMFNPDEKRGFGRRFWRRARRQRRRDREAKGEDEDDVGDVKESVEEVGEEVEEEPETETKGTRGGRRGRGRARAEPEPEPEEEEEEEEDDGEGEDEEDDGEEEVAESDAESDADEDIEEDEDQDSDDEEDIDDSDTSSSETDEETPGEDGTLVRDTREMFADVEGRINLWREVERQGEERSLAVLRGDHMDVDEQVKEEDGEG